MNWPSDFVNKIICGDCLEVMKGIPDKAVDLVLTDPPYLNTATTSTSTKQSADYDKRNIGDLSLIKAFFRQFENEIFRITKPESKLLIFCDECLYPILFECFYNRFDLSLLVWKKNLVGLGRNYRKCFELIVYAKRENAINFGEFRRNIIEADCCKDKEHPTQKPVELIKYLISPEIGDIILDPFLGSGTTAVACKELGRKFIGIEINPKYCKIAQRRLAQEYLFT